jgi:hypothetical protein
MRLIDADNLKKSVMDCDLWYENADVWVVVDLIDEAPTVEGHQEKCINAPAGDCSSHKKATWIVTAGETLKVKCSECNYKINYFWNDCQNAKFCPYCGAIMDGEPE